METNINIEPHGNHENEERHNSELPAENKRYESSETDDNDNDLAGVAAGNLPEEEKETTHEESAIKKDNQHGEDTEQRDPRGFMGDFAAPQHDD